MSFLLHSSLGTIIGIGMGVGRLSRGSNNVGISIATKGLDGICHLLAYIINKRKIKIK
jgi:hypothetical protein